MLQNGFFKTFDGTRIYYEVQGDGPALLFCYGLVCSKLHWSYQMDYFLKKGFKVIWFDYRGHHNSESPKDPTQLTVQNIARDGIALLDELKIQKATFLGHSMGVNIVLDMYRQAPERARALVLANGSARAPLETMFRSNVTQVIFPALYRAYKRFPKISKIFWESQGQNRFVQWAVGMLGFNPSLSKPEDIRTYVEMTSKLDVSVFMNLLQNYETYDATALLSKIQVPSLVISGENDIIIPSEAQEIMHQLIPQSRYEVIRNGSHCPQMDLPELLNLILDRFLTDVHSNIKISTATRESTPTANAPRKAASVHPLR